MPRAKPAPQLVKIIVSEEEFSPSAGKFVEWHHYETEAEVLPKRLRVSYGKNCSKLLPRFGGRDNAVPMTRWVEGPIFRGSGKRWVFRTPEAFKSGFLRYTSDQLVKDLSSRSLPAAAG